MRAKLRQEPDYERAAYWRGYYAGTMAGRQLLDVGMPVDRVAAMSCSINAPYHLGLRAGIVGYLFWINLRS